MNKRGRPYEDEEIEQLLIESLQPNARSPENLELLAERFGRTPGAIDMVIRWCQGARFPQKANNRIKRQVAAAKARLSVEFEIEFE